MTKRNYVSLITIAIVVLLGSSCNKDTGLIGLDIHQQNNSISIHIDSSGSVKTNTIRYDTLLRSISNYGLIGNINDEKLGTYSSSFVAQFLPDNNIANINETYHLDSITLTFHIGSFIGDSLSSIKIDAYQITQNIEGWDSINSTDLNITDYLLNPINFQDYYYNRPSDTSDQISFRLTDNIANIFFNRPNDTLDFNDIIANDSLFLEEFNGIYITTTIQENRNAMIGLLTTTSTSKITMHFTIVTDTTNSQNSFSFNCNNTTNFSVFNNNYMPSLPIDDISDNDSLFYIHTMNGLNGLIDFTDLAKWRDSSNIIINQAVLFIESAGDSLEYLDYPLPFGLAVLKHPDKISYDFIEDYASSQGLVAFNTETNQYQISVTEFVQDYILGKTDLTKYRLYPADNYNTAKRIVLKGGSHSNKPKLIIKYSKI